MILISHRGNTQGKIPEHENHPDYVMDAISLGYDCEVDVRFESGQWVLGHDEGSYVVKEDWLWNEKLWVHCKNYTAVEKLVKLKNLSYYPVPCNWFWHEETVMTLTSKGWIWTYPNKTISSVFAITVLPEIPNWDLKDVMRRGFGGVCSDFIENYK